LGQRLEVVLEDQLGIEQQTPDQGRLAVVHAAAGEKAQQGLVLLLRQVLAQVLELGNGHGAGGRAVHQKYPSRFFFSIDAFSSWSMTRPWRSDVVAVSISDTISSIVTAGDSTAPVSG